MCRRIGDLLQLLLTPVPDRIAFPFSCKSISATSLYVLIRQCWVVIECLVLQANTDIAFCCYFCAQKLASDVQEFYITLTEVRHLPKYQMSLEAAVTSFSNAQLLTGQAFLKAVLSVFRHTFGFDTGFVAMDVTQDDALGKGADKASFQLQIVAFESNDDAMVSDWENVEFDPKGG
jgi:hypothetical protein